MLTCLNMVICPHAVQNLQIFPLKLTLVNWLLLVSVLTQFIETSWKIIGCRWIPRGLWIELAYYGGRLTLFYVTSAARVWEPESNCFYNHFSAKKWKWFKNEAENGPKTATVNNPTIKCRTVGYFINLKLEMSSVDGPSRTMRTWRLP